VSAEAFPLMKTVKLTMAVWKCYQVYFLLEPKPDSLEWGLYC